MGICPWRGAYYTLSLFISGHWMNILLTFNSALLHYAVTYPKYCDKAAIAWILKVRVKMSLPPLTCLILSVFFHNDRKLCDAMSLNYKWQRRAEYRSKPSKIDQSLWYSVCTEYRAPLPGVSWCCLHSYSLPCPKHLLVSWLNINVRLTFL